MRHHSLCGIVIWAILALVGPGTTSAEAQNNVGGHFGILFPIVSHANDTTTDISDDCVIGFPVGITVRKSPTLAFDLELVPVIQNEPLDISLEIHPGVLYRFAEGWNAGVRMAFGVNQASWGFTPLLNYGDLVFAEVVLPIRFKEDGFGDGFTSIGFGVHLGVGF
jgi:hypothetical protein